MVVIPTKIKINPIISIAVIELPAKRLSNVVIGLPSNSIEVAIVIFMLLMPLYHVKT